jgi:hypothetical protein
LLQNSKKKEKKEKFDDVASFFFFFSALFTELSLKKKQRKGTTRAPSTLLLSAYCKNILSSSLKREREIQVKKEGENGVVLVDVDFYLSLSSLSSLR